jgi:hypothetical protein
MTLSLQVRVQLDLHVTDYDASRLNRLAIDTCFMLLKISAAKPMPQPKLTKLLSPDRRQFHRGALVKASELRSAFESAIPNPSCIRSEPRPALSER